MVKCIHSYPIFTWQGPMLHNFFLSLQLKEKKWAVHLINDIMSWTELLHKSRTWDVKHVPLQWLSGNELKRCTFHLHRTVAKPLMPWCNKWNMPAIPPPQNGTVDILQHLCLQEGVTSSRWSADMLLNNAQLESWGQHRWPLKHKHCLRQICFHLCIFFK